MRTARWCAVISFIASAIGAAPALLAQDPGSVTSVETVVSDMSGPALYKSYCSSCHGVAAKGDGLLAEHLRYRPADLTLIAKRNRGTFDRDRVYRTIDGRDPVKGHGGTDMPVWGDAFKRSGDGNDEETVKRRIQSLVDFLGTLQVK